MLAFDCKSRIDKMAADTLYVCACMCKRSGATAKEKREQRSWRRGLEVGHSAINPSAPDASHWRGLEAPKATRSLSRKR